MQTRADTGARPGLGQGVEVEAFQFPCSISQRMFWLFEQMHPGDCSGNIESLWRLSGKLDRGIAGRAFNALLERHEPLRTMFRAIEGEPVQLVLPRAGLQVALIDLRQKSLAERETEQERICREEACRSFDLGTAPLLRVTLVQLEDEEHVAVVVVHHMVADGWSIGVLAEDFARYYQAFAEDRSPDLPALEIQYADFAVWQQELLESGELDSAAEYWKQKLAGVEQLELASDFPRPPLATTRGDEISVLLPTALSEGLQDFSRGEGVTLYATAVAALNILLWQRTGRTDLAIGTQAAGRNQVEVEDLVGTFINPLVLRTKVSPELGFTELLQRVDTTIAGALGHQELPFERLVEILRPKRDAARPVLISINLVFQRSFIKDRQFAGITLTDLPSYSSGAQMDLNFYMIERAEGWRFSCEFNTDLFSPATIERLLSDFQELLRAIVENPRRTVTELAAAVTAPRGTTGRKQLREKLEAELIAIWEDVLTVHPVSPSDDFFELGGHSLLATRMLSRVEKATGKRPTLAMLFQNPTIQQLSRVLLGEERPASIPGLVGIQAQGTKTPIFCLHGVPSMAILAQELGTDQPFFAVHLPETAQLRPPYTVENIAAIHVATIRRAQPQGPYLLAGWCREGLLAYEVAQQLRSQGEQVGLVAMFDTWMPDYPALSPAENRRAERLLRMARTKLRLQQMRQMGLAQTLAYMPGVLGEAFNDQLRHLKWRLRYRLQQGNGEAAAITRSQDEILFLAVDNYHARPYEGRVLLFRSDKYRTWKYWDAVLGWRPLLSRLEVHEIPGVHDSMLTGPSLPEIARAIAAAAEQSNQIMRPDSLKARA